MKRLKIMGTGVCFPEKIVTNDDLSKIMDTNDQWIRERTGIKQRRIAQRELNEFPSLMGAKAAKEALERAKLDPEKIDLILFATCTPDYKVPNCASLVQTELGIQNKCGAVDIGAACSGFVYGLNMANALIQTGAIEHALIIGSELLSPELDWSERTTSILFGDGAGAAVVGACPESESSEVLAQVLSADGQGKEFFFHKYGGSREPLTEEILRSKNHFMVMQGKEMFRVAVRTLCDNAKKLLIQSGIGPHEVNWVIPHQANIRILEATAKALEMDFDRFVINIDRYGNTSAATIPTALHEAISDGRVQRGQVLLLDAFGAGLTAGATLLRY